MLKRFMLIGLVVSVTVVALGLTFGRIQAANESVVKVSMQEWKMDIAPTTVVAGTPVRFEISNNGQLQHEVVLEKAGEVDQALEAEVNGKDVSAEAEAIDPGTTKTLEWTFTEPGTYWAACHIKEHFENGMKTTFTVVAAPSDSPTTIAALIALGGVLILLGGFGARKLIKR